jgi:hypothetical protein
MTYVDVDELRKGVYFMSATLDPRFVWTEIDPLSLSADDPLIGSPGVVQPVLDGPVIFADNLRRFRLVDCAHREEDRDGKLCTHCGQPNPYEPPAQTAARKATPKK